MNPVAAKTLNRSTTPKYPAGTIFIPKAPTSIITSAAAAHIPYDRQSLLFIPAMIMTVSERIESITTRAVTEMCILS